MIDYVKIENTLKQLDTAFQNSLTDPYLPILLSKTAVIEFSGWIEDSLDQMLHDYLNNHICEPTIIKYIKEQIKTNYGFQYEKNVLKIISITIGAYHLENILDKINVTLFQSILDQYSRIRNTAAHTHIVGTTNTFNAPSTVLNDFIRIKPIFANIEKEMQSLP